MKKATENESDSTKTGKNESTSAQSDENEGKNESASTKTCINECASAKTDENEVTNESASTKTDENEETMGIKDAVLTSLGVIFPTWDVYSDVFFAIDMSMPRCNYRIGK